MITLMVSTIIPVIVRKEIKERKKKQEQIPQKNSFSDKRRKEICQMLTFNTGKHLAREQTIVMMVKMIVPLILLT